AFMTGYAKRYVNEFGWTMAFSVMVSMLVSFTLTPMMSSLLLKRRRSKSGEEEHSSRERVGFFHSLATWYGRLLAWSLDHRFVVSVLAWRFLRPQFCPIPASAVIGSPRTIR